MLAKETGPTWVIIETKPASEEVAERSLRQAGYRVYLPRFRKLLTPHGRDRKPASAMRPLFPRLIFAQDWRGWPDRREQIVIGALRVMPANRAGGVAKLSDTDIAVIMRKERTLAFDQVKWPPGSGPIIRNDIAPGDRVEVDLHGTAVLGILEELSDDGKATIRAVIFGREVPIRDVDADALQLVDA